MVILAFFHHMKLFCQTGRKNNLASLVELLIELKMKKTALLVKLSLPNMAIDTDTANLVQTAMTT
jgi:hypothetical protein